MTRYLTPSKIGLLALAVLLSEGLVSSDAIFPIVNFLLYRILPQLATDCEAHEIAEPAPLTMDLSDFESALKGLASAITGRNIMDKFLEKLWSLDSLHSLHEFFRELNDIMLATRPAGQGEEEGERLSKNEIYIHKASPVGMFMRRCYIEFFRLQFDDIVKLWNAFLKFREPSEAQFRKRRRSSSQSKSNSDVLDANLKEIGVSVDDLLAKVVYPTPGRVNAETLDLSREEMERMLEFQLERLQRFGDRVPDAVRKTCQTMLDTAFGAPTMIYFVRFFDAWRSGDYSTALENIHQYFDQTMISQERVYYHYALLHTAILHADFGAFGEAVTAMTEAIAAARENHDVSCLNFSLSWLYYLTKAHPREMKFGQESAAGSLGGQREMLAYLKVKAKEMRVPNLLSSTLLEEAKMVLGAGENVGLAFERMYQSGHINTMYNIQYNFSSQILVQSSIFGRLGFAGVANAYSNVILDCYDKCTPIEELLRASARNAFSLAQSGQYHSAIDTLETLDYTRKRNLHAHQYLSLAIGVLKLKRALRRHDLNTAQLLLTQLLQSASTSSPSLIVDSELAFQIRLFRIDYLQRLGSYPEALDRIEDLAKELEEEDADVYQRIQVMILKAGLFANVGKAVKGFSLAVKAGRIAWEGRSGGQMVGSGVGSGSTGVASTSGGSGSAAGLGGGGKMMPLVWEAWAAVALILCELEEYDAARRILDAVIPQAHASGGISASGSNNSRGGLGSGVGAAAGDLGLLAKLYSLQADAFMGMAGKAEETSLARSSNMSKADGYLDKSLKYFKKLDDIRGECDCLKKKMLIANVRGDKELADDWGRRYIAAYDAFVGSVQGGDDQRDDEDEGDIQEVDEDEKAINRELES